MVLALPAGMLLDRWFRPALAGSGVLVAAGGLVRLGGDTYAWVLAGQTLVAVAQPVALSAVTKLAGHYLPSEQRPSGIAVGAGAGFVGMLIALVMGPTVGAHGHIERLLVVQAVIGVVTGFALVLAMLAPGHPDHEHAAIEGSAARALWALPTMRLLCGLVFVGFGIFVALATWLQTLLHPSGISEGEAGAPARRDGAGGHDRLRGDPAGGGHGMGGATLHVRRGARSGCSDARCSPRSRSSPDVRSCWS